MFKVNKAHKKKHQSEIEDIIDCLRWSGMDREDVRDSAEEVVEYFCKWMEDIINKKKVVSKEKPSKHRVKFPKPRVKSSKVIR